MVASVNIPLMRRLELENGLMLETDDGHKVGESVTAARQGISMVVMSRVGMAAPGKYSLLNGWLIKY